MLYYENVKFHLLILSEPGMTIFFYKRISCEKIFIHESME